MQDIQVMLKSDAHHASIRSLKVLAFFHCCHFLLVTVAHMNICCCSQPAVGPSVPSGEGAWYNHLGYSSEGEGHESVPAVSWLSQHYQQHPATPGPAGLCFAAQV